MPKLQCIDSSRRMYWYCSEQGLVVVQRAGPEGRVHDRLDEGDQEFVLVADRRHFVVGVEDLALVQTEALDDVLVGVGVDRLLKGLAQQELAAFGSGDVPVGAQHDVVGGQRVGGDEEAQIALDDAPLVLAQTVRVLPERDVAAHVHFLRHPMVGAGGEVLLPGPFVLERHQLVDVGLAVDDALVGCVHAPLRDDPLVLEGGRGRRLGPMAGGVLCGELRAGFDFVFPMQHGGSSWLKLSN
jgi:hypothetical protein